MLVTALVVSAVLATVLFLASVRQPRPEPIPVRVRAARPRRPLD